MPARHGANPVPCAVAYIPRATTDSVPISRKAPMVTNNADAAIVHTGYTSHRSRYWHVGSAFELPVWQLAATAGPG